MSAYYVNYADSLKESGLREVVRFEFVGGGRRPMTREEILLHVVHHGIYHHGIYHRGFVGDMLHQVPAASPANDLPVYLRDAHSPAWRCSARSQRRRLLAGARRR